MHLIPNHLASSSLTQKLRSVLHIVHFSDSLHRVHVSKNSCYDATIQTGIDKIELPTFNLNILLPHVGIYTNIPLPQIEIDTK